MRTNPFFCVCFEKKAKESFHRDHIHHFLEHILSLTVLKWDRSAYDGLHITQGERKAWKMQTFCTASQTHSQGIGGEEREEGEERKHYCCFHTKYSMNIPKLNQL